MLDGLLDNIYPYASFHDSILQRIGVDYVKRELKMEFQISIGNPDASVEKELEGCRAGRLTFSELHFFIVEPPDSEFQCHEAEGLWMVNYDLMDTEELLQEHKLPQQIPEETFVVRFFVNDWNSFIFVAAKEASFKWT